MGLGLRFLQHLPQEFRYVLPTTVSNLGGFFPRGLIDIYLAAFTLRVSQLTQDTIRVFHQRHHCLYSSRLLIGSQEYPSTRNIFLPHRFNGVDLFLQCSRASICQLPSIDNSSGQESCINHGVDNFHGKTISNVIFSRDRNIYLGL